MTQSQHICMVTEKKKKSSSIIFAVIQAFFASASVANHHEEISHVYRHTVYPIYSICVLIYLCVNLCACLWNTDMLKSLSVPFRL